MRMDIIDIRNTVAEVAFIAGIVLVTFGVLPLAIYVLYLFANGRLPCH